MAPATPAGVLAQLRQALQEADTLMGHDDNATEWRDRWAYLWADEATPRPAAAAEVEDLRRDLADNAALRERMAELLTGVAVALRGPQPPLTRWSWHDLPDRAAAAVAAIDVMQRAAFMAADPERHNAELTGNPGSYCK